MKLLLLTLLLCFVLTAYSHSQQSPTDAVQHNLRLKQFSRAHFDGKNYQFRRKLKGCRCVCTRQLEKVRRQCRGKESCEIIRCSRKKISGFSCCQTPSPSPSRSPTPSPSATPSSSVTPSPSGSVSPTPSPKIPPGIIGADSCNLDTRSMLVLLLDDGSRLPTFILSTQQLSETFRDCVNNDVGIQKLDPILELLASGRCGNVARCPMDANGDCTCENSRRCLDSITTFRNFLNACT